MTLTSGITVPVERIAEICRRYQVRELSLFGSSIRGDVGPESDIDILEAIFGRRIDLVTKLGLKPWARPHVLRERQARD